MTITHCQSAFLYHEKFFCSEAASWCSVSKNGTKRNAGRNKKAQTILLQLWFVWSNIMEIISPERVNIKQDTKRQYQILCLIVYNFFNGSNAAGFPWATCSLWFMGTTSRTEACWATAEKRLKEESSFLQAVMKALLCSGIHKGGSVDFTEQDTADTLA